MRSYWVLSCFLIKERWFGRLTWLETISGFDFLFPQILNTCKFGQIFSYVFCLMKNQKVSLNFIQSSIPFQIYNWHFWLFPIYIWVCIFGSWSGNLYAILRRKVMIYDGREFPFLKRWFLSTKSHYLLTLEVKSHTLFLFFMSTFQKISYFLLNKGYFLMF